MVTDPADDLISDLTDLRARIACGDLTQLDRIAARIELSVADLYLRQPSAVQLTNIRALAGQNMPLIDAATKGLRAARLRLFEVHQAKAGMATYDRDGQRNLIGKGVGPTHRS